ncbi:geranyl-CoA carboxylase alpha subunit [Marinobacter daqiaonensis]|uniref:Biotin carboxylase n=1 Tax=Marinobacter daqiaonensis TaxID=650891 RepID=A0A1I6IN49_9GAMM|nr:acetyl/propionyl/methylcrotonyl-CoA carboxylase subunit alpha [Marinobacter daqiaonensis]SFR68187.1 geranyl-CoA carboxylase alpha subunit [Marinobacter daqiaonensis]
MTTTTANQPTPFSKVLVANRGEIALRVIRSARDLGYRTVAVYSTADRNARHVRAADQAVAIGGDLPADSYLRIDRIIEAARLSGADAIHPGYGFLAENPELPRACREAGLVFIGPSAESIVAMGHKAGAKRLMMDAGVPCVPGYQGEDQSEDRLIREADEVGFPVMIKATAGGGGRGMRLVETAEDFPAALGSARSEAESAFGDPEVILERAIINPRHIEIQVMADRYGNAVYIGERDCSIQRRHQKVVEEAPSPAVSPELRARMGETAVAAVKAINYEGAGTLEFLLDQDGNFYFMEMNTRLQVEHPVTESITGLDLVELQLRVAAGQPLPLDQDDIVLKGHSIEVRLCAESPSEGFMPQSGTMALWHMPSTLRVEDAVETGSEIPPFYDSMIAKLISTGADREEARRRLVSGLQDATALGVETNQAFLRACLEHPTFIRGEATTAFVANHQDELLARDKGIDARARLLAAVLLYTTDAWGVYGGSISTITHRLPIIFRFSVDGEAADARVSNQGNGCFQVQLNDDSTELTLDAVNGSQVRFGCQGLSETADLVREGSRLYLRYRGQSYRVDDHTHEAATAGDEAGDGIIRASMNGRVVALHASEGDAVEAGQPIIVLEAMKMEHVHTATVAGTLTSLTVSEGEQVTAGRVVAEITPENEAPAKNEG